jgi:hypothetical protein
VAYAILAEGRSQEELEELDAAIGMTEGPEQAAMAELNAYREQMGLEPLPMPPPAGQDEEIR